MPDRRTPTRPRYRHLTWLAINAVVVVALILIPLFAKPFQNGQYTQTLAIAVAVMGLALLTGFTGQVSVGHSAFFGVGAYFTAILKGTASMPTFGALGLAVVAGALIGALVGVPSLRIKGTYLAIVTLVLAASFPAVVNLFSSVTAGTAGLSVDRIQSPPTFFLAVDQVRYYFVLIGLFVVALLLLVLNRSRLGRSLRALGDNEIAATTFGVHAAQLRISVFSASAAVTALGGGLFVLNSGFISSTTSYVTTVGSIELLTALVIGGRALFLGPLIGTVIAEWVPRQVSEQAPEWSNFVYGAILITVLLVVPGGITGFDRARLTHRLRPQKQSSPPPTALSSFTNSSQPSGSESTV